MFLWKDKHGKNLQIKFDNIESEFFSIFKRRKEKKMTLLSMNYKKSANHSLFTWHFAVWFKVAFCKEKLEKRSQHIVYFARWIKVHFFINSLILFVSKFKSPDILKHFKGYKGQILMPNISEDLLTSKIQNWWVDILTPKINKKFDI
jgi:hypothetical protein